VTYTIVRTPRFEGEFVALAAQDDVVNDMLAGLQFVLERTPYVHPEVPGTPYRVAVTQQGEPRLRVYYDVGEREVHLISADIAV
jgi:hypothetical protein